MCRFKLWGSEIHEAPPEVTYEEVMASDKGVAKWTSKIVRPTIPITPTPGSNLTDTIPHSSPTASAL